MIPTVHLRSALPVTLDLDGLALNRSADDAEYVIEKLTGWYDSPGVKQNRRDRPSGDGAFADPTMRAARAIGIEGICYTRDRGTLVTQADRLAALPGGTVGRLVVADPDVGERWCDVVLGGSVLIEVLGDTHFAFKVDVVAPDPIKYGTTQQVEVAVAAEAAGGLGFDLFTDDTAAPPVDTGVLEFGEAGESNRGILRNIGTVATVPTFRVSGPCDGFEIREAATDSSLVYSEPVPDGSVVVIDPDGSVTLDGVADRSAYLTVRQWWTLPPGEERVVSLIAAGGPATLRISYNSGWW